MPRHFSATDIAAIRISICGDTLRSREGCETVSVQQAVGSAVLHTVRECFRSPLLVVTWEHAPRAEYVDVEVDWAFTPADQAPGTEGHYELERERTGIVAHIHGTAVQASAEAVRAGGLMGMSLSDVAGRFKAFRTVFEICGQSQFVLTDVRTHCPDLVDRIHRGVEPLDGNLEWWADIGGRLHAAEVALLELRADGLVTGADLDDDSDDLEGRVLFLEGVVARARETCPA